MKKGATNNGNFPCGGHGEVKFKQPYVVWYKEMDRQFATILCEQMVQGHKCDGDTWKPQALQAAVTYLNLTFKLTLTKDDIENRLKYLQKHYDVVRDIQTNQTDFTWDDEQKMVVVPFHMWSSWTAYCQTHPDARGMQNRVIRNWDEIVLLCGKNRATGHGAKIYDEDDEIEVDSVPIQTPEAGFLLSSSNDEIEVNSAPIQTLKARARPSSSTSEKKKKIKHDSMVEVVGKIATTLQEYFASKKTTQERPSGIEIYEIVSRIPGLTRDEIFKGTRKLINSNAEEFKLLKALQEDEKKEWICCLLNS